MDLENSCKPVSDLEKRVFFMVLQSISNAVVNIRFNTTCMTHHSFSQASTLTINMGHGVSLFHLV